jgi:hypothetical protein
MTDGESNAFARSPPWAEEGEITFGLSGLGRERYGATRFLARLNRLLARFVLALGVFGGVAVFALRFGLVSAITLVFLGLLGLVVGLSAAEGLEIFVQIEQRQRIMDFRLQEVVRVTARRSAEAP